MLRELELPSTHSYHTDSEHPPLELYMNVLPLISTMDLELGFFNTAVFSILSVGMAQFIQNGGVLRIVTNEKLTYSDSDLIYQQGQVSEKIESYVKDPSTLRQLQEILEKREQHFYNCLLYLKNNGRLVIQPIKPKYSIHGMAHSKICVVSDGLDQLYWSGSANYTANALIANTENIDVVPSWLEPNHVANNKINSFYERFEKIIKKEHTNYYYLEENELDKYVIERGVEKVLHDLLSDEYDIKLAVYEETFYPQIKKLLLIQKESLKKKLDQIKNEPRFPSFGKPRQYQEDAYIAWVQNNYQGIFAMATGTGKTITSLNCVLNLYKINFEYSVIIIVPTVTLLKQWITEAKQFNFNNIIATAESANWENELNRYLFNRTYGIGNNNNYVFITTYATFNKTKCQRLIKKINDDKTILIADEAHNFGATNSIKNIPQNIVKRIGLSATPERIYDEYGSEKINTFFNSYPPIYTYRFTMKQAIDQDFLTPYYYYPYFVNLEHDELEAYLEITRQLVKFFDFEKQKFKDTATHLLIKRKRIVHKAQDKKRVLKQIFQDVELKNNSLKYTFVYVPEGYESNVGFEDEYDIQDDDTRIINSYSEIINSFGYKTYQFLGETKNRETILEQFKQGYIEILTAMKTLDEGVDIPITKNAIFCASTGNPRQFIQRRGRVLRKYKGKTHANIYDMIVVPRVELMGDECDELKKMEINIFRAELMRVANFMYSSENMIEVMNDKIHEMAIKYDIDIYNLINENIEKDR